jgi:mannose-1-phosphate guanylyltransferase
VCAGALVDGSVVFDSAVIGTGSRIYNSIIGAGAVIGSNCCIEGAVIGDGAMIGDGNELLTGVRVWPDTNLASLTVRFSSDRT